MDIASTAALGITFPFNLVLDIAFYLGAARALMPTAVGKAPAIERPPLPMAGGGQNESSFAWGEASEAPSHDRR
jgi:hypothetical protein